VEPEGVTTRRVPQATTGSNRTLEALVGFYVGMLLVIAVPLAFVAIVGDVSRLTSFAPYLALPLAVPVVLAIVPRTRRLGRYMLLGMVSTALVVGIVGGGVLWVLISTS
jgi:hypothetical protein